MKNIPVILFGSGNVGCTLLRQIVDSRETVAARNHIRFDVLALLDSRGWNYEPTAFTDQQLLTAVDNKQAGHRLGGDRPGDLEVVNMLMDAGIRNAILVDTTAAAGMKPLIDKALENDYCVVLANKKPLTGRWATAQHYFNDPRIRYESTVGGGQPVIATLRYLRDTNDLLLSIEGQLSGTLGYICSRLDDGVPFSEAVLEARSRGYTEPDPRDDLGGMDVKRKIMILGRLAGWPLEEEDIKVESLYHSSLAHLTIEEFLDAVVAMDPAMTDRVTAAQQLGQRLRYIARVNEKGGSVGLTGLPSDSPLAGMKYIRFKTAFYEDEPMVIAGKGAGLEMTAAGVLGDMIGLAREVF
jgi:homoserine dehydrogenase